MIYELIPTIKDHPIFRGADKNYVNIFFNRDNVSVKDFPARTVAYSSDTGMGQVAIMVSGIARVYAGGIPDAPILRTLHRGDLFGIANLYSGGEIFPSRIITEGECQILFIGGDKFKEFIEGDPRILKNYLAFQSRKIVFLNKKILTFTAGSSERRLAYFIYDNTVEDRFTPPCTMIQLATMLQMGRASLYRAVDSLVSEKIVQKENKNSFLVDKSKLRDFLNRNS